MLYLIGFKCKNENIKNKIFKKTLSELRKYKQYDVNSYYDFKIIRIEHEIEHNYNNLKSNYIIINLYSDDLDIKYKEELNINYKLHNIDSILVNIMLYFNHHKIIKGLYI